MFVGLKNGSEVYVAEPRPLLRVSVECAPQDVDEVLTALKNIYPERWGQVAYKSGYVDAPRWWNPWRTEARWTCIDIEVVDSRREK